MKQIIKFKAWSPISKVMEYEPTVSCSGAEDYDVNYVFTNKSGTDERVWLQFTGLKDKNGKEIYEGDVVREINRKNWKVEFDAEYGGFYPFTYCSDGMGYECGTVRGKNVEIIGNIYEHPNLLSVDNN